MSAMIPYLGLWYSDLETESFIASSCIAVFQSRRITRMADCKGSG